MGIGTIYGDDRKENGNYYGILGLYYTGVIWG